MPKVALQLDATQRQLFARVASLVRAHPSDFVPVGKWLDKGADYPEAAQRTKDVRQQWRRKARSRRQNDISYLVPGFDGSLESLRFGRIAEAHAIRADREGGSRQPTRSELLRHVAYSLLDKPPNYSATAADREARLVLLVVWLLTDKKDLEPQTRITKMQRWEWCYGEDRWERFVDRADFDRLYLRTVLIDPRVKEWEAMIGDALQELGVGGEEKETESEREILIGPSEQADLLRVQATFGDSRRAQIAANARRAAIKAGFQFTIENRGPRGSWVNRNEFMPVARWWRLRDERKRKPTPAAPTPVQRNLSRWKCLGCGVVAFAAEKPFECDCPKSIFVREDRDRKSRT